MRMPWEQLFPEAARIGFDGVELDIGRNYRETAWMSAEGRQQIRRWSEASGCALASVCLGAFWQISPADNKPEVRAEARALTLDTIRSCHELGVAAFLAPVTPGAEVEHETGVQRWIEEMGACAKTAEENGVIIALENVGRGYAQSAVNLKRIIDAIGSRCVAAYYDPGNGLSLGNDPVAEIRLLGKQIAVAHAKDPGGQYLGEGRLDWDGVIAAFRDVGYNGWMTLETAATDNPSEAGAKNLAFLRQRFG
jgi:sugar phosphate isomerase/epimerase